MILRLVLAIAGTGLFIAGFVLLLRAGWVWLAVTVSPLIATLILGAGLALVGGGLLWAAVARKRPAASPARDPIADMVTAFLQGAAAGRDMRRRGL